MLVVIYFEEEEGHVLFLDVFISSFTIIYTSLGINNCFILFSYRQEGFEWHLISLLVINNHILGINAFQAGLTFQWEQSIPKCISLLMIFTVSTYIVCFLSFIISVP
jgi:hypothetical protein